MTPWTTRRQFLQAAAVLAVPRYASAACGGDKTLRIRRATDFVTFDPADVSGEDEIITRNLFAPLVRYKKRKDDTETWAWQRHLIEEVTSDSDRKYRFRLRKGETWTAGGDVTTEDVKFSFERVAGLTSPRIAAQNQSLWERLETVDRTNEYAGTIVLKTDDPNLILGTLPTGVGCVVSKKAVSALSGGRFDLTPGPTTGRYKLKQAVARGDRAVLVCDDSWQGDPVSVREATFRYIPDNATAQAEADAGHIDVYDAGRDVLYRVAERTDRSAQSGRFVTAPTSRVLYLALTTLNGALRNPDLRRAIQQAISPEDVARAAYGPAEPKNPLRLPVATGLIPLGWPGRPAARELRFDSKAAVSLLQKTRGAALTIATPDDPVRVRAAEEIVRQLEQVGQRVNVIKVEFARMAMVFSDRHADMGLFLASVYAAGLHAPFERFRVTPLPGRRAMHTGIHESKEFDGLLNDARRSGKPDHLKALQARLERDGLVLPLAEDYALWWVRHMIVPSFWPNGSIGDLGDWQDRR